MDVRLDLASRFLSALICRDPKRSIDSRISEVRHALLLADVLIAAAEPKQECSLHLHSTEMQGQDIPAAAPLTEPDVPLDYFHRHLPTPATRPTGPRRRQPPTLH